MVDTKSNSDSSKLYIKLMKDSKHICRTECPNPPGYMPFLWSVDIVSRSDVPCLPGLPYCHLLPAAETTRDQNEWVRFASFLQSRNKVAIARFENGEFYILPPSEADFSWVRVAYQFEKGHNASDRLGKKPGANIDSSRRARVPGCKENFSPYIMSLQKLREHNSAEIIAETSSCSKPQVIKEGRPLERNYIRADPSYLQTLGQAHSGWIFGAIAELVDNSRDAKATRLDIKIELIFSKLAGKDIPMLSVIDDGCGMTHQEVLRMTYFGHKQPQSDDQDRIGRFGVGFKTGAMRLGRDALVLTQTANSRSVAFLSQTLNEGKDNLEIPVVSYRRKGQFMEIDTGIQSEGLAKHNLKAIKEISPFDKYFIGEKAGLFCKKDTGTQIYIWNLDEWGSNYCLEWQTGLNGGSSFHQGDILIRSRRIRSRPGQISQKVPLDYSLRSYLEVIFLDPQMRMYVQGSQVKIRPLAKTLSNTCVETGFIMGKHVQVTLGHFQLEWEQANCGIFLYWHGRLIESYKRVGGMVHNGDMGRGVIGVIDVTYLMNDGDGCVWVHNNKQGFQDCEEYVLLEQWLGKKADEYWDENYNELQLRKGNSLYKPDLEWVQCGRCRKWRILDPGCDSTKLPLEWFCYMKPFNGSCDFPEQKIEPGVITVSAKRTGYASEEKQPVQSKDVAADDSGIRPKRKDDEERDDTMEDGKQEVKKVRMILPRLCKKV